MKTAEEFLREKLVDFKKNHYGKSRDFLANLMWETVSEWMIEFAKMCTEEALKQASEKACLHPESNCYDEGGYCSMTRVDRDSILNAYSLENIK